MQFVQALFTVVSFVALSQAAAIPPIGSVLADQGQGVMSGVCDQVADRFYKFGQCISGTSQFQSLNSTFWYQAARSELCGYPFSFSSPSPQQVESNLTAISNGKSNAQTDIQLELQAQYIYLMKSSGEAATTSTDAELSAATEEYMNAEKRGFGIASFALPQCVNACNILQKYSNYVEPCWEVTGLTVLYGVCEVGCRYYF